MVFRISQNFRKDSKLIALAIGKNNFVGAISESVVAAASSAGREEAVDLNQSGLSDDVAVTSSVAADNEENDVDDETMSADNDIEHPSTVQVNSSLSLQTDGASSALPVESLPHGATAVPPFSFASITSLGTTDASEIVPLNDVQHAVEDDRPEVYSSQSSANDAENGNSS